MIEVVNLNKSFGEIDVLHDINIKINKGEKVVVVGPSGSGKSTFLRCLNCMEDPTSGSIIFNGVDIADMKVDINIHRQKMGMVFQHFNLFNNKTVIENIMLAPVYVEKKRMKKLRRKNPNNETVKSVKEIKADANAFNEVITQNDNNEQITINYSEELDTNKSSVEQEYYNVKVWTEGGYAIYNQTYIVNTVENKTTWLKETYSITAEMLYKTTLFSEENNNLTIKVNGEVKTFAQAVSILEVAAFFINLSLLITTLVVI